MTETVPPSASSAYRRGDSPADPSDPETGSIEPGTAHPLGESRYPAGAQSTVALVSAEVQP